MIVSSLGIHVPYTFDATAYAACHLGHLANGQNIPVSILSYQKHDQGVRSDWDAKVLSGRRNHFVEWANRHSHLIFFDVQRKKLQKAVDLGRHLSLILFWDRLSPEDLDCLHYFDQIICPSFIAEKNTREAQLHENLELIPWDSGMPRTGKMAPFSNSNLNLLVMMTGKTAKWDAPAILSVLRILLDGYPELELTLALTRSGSRADNKHFDDLLRDFPARVCIKRKPGWNWRAMQYQRSHWLWLPDSMTHTGQYALEALANNCPVIAFDIAPYNEIIKSGYNGHLIVCDHRTSWLGYPFSAMNSKEMLKGLEEALSNFGYHQDLRNQPWDELNSRRYNFQKKWRSLWGLG